MAVNHEIKTQLAKLLATENFVVEHKDVNTASFDVYDRILVLPLWKLASNVVYDLLVAHECSHALFTPNEDWRDKISVPLQFVNVVEDARIEKLMKRKYPGLAKTFYQGYQELNDDDFFAIGDEDIDTFNLADRGNLYFKVGHFVDVAFSEREKQIISLIEDCETFDDTLNAAQILYDYCKDAQEKKETPTSEEKEETSSLPTSEEETEEEDERTWEEEEKREEPLEVKTDNAFNDNIEELNDTQNHLESIYCEIPEVLLDRIIVSNSVIHDKLDVCFSEQIQDGRTCEPIDQEYLKFKKYAQKEVNYLVKEFECKKSADSYARTTVAKTGVLDCSKLHTYKFNEDLFKKVNIVPDGKSHGLIFLLDWSGSMCECLMDTLKQLYNLIWFCKKVQIPFEVYTFTNAYLKTEYDDEGKSIAHFPNVKKRKENELRVGEEFKLLNWLTSSSNKATLESHMINLWRVASSVCNRYYFEKVKYYTLPEFNLGGTPLNETLVSLHQIIPHFQKNNRVQKTQCIILSDGEANPLPVLQYTQNRFDIEPILRPRHLKAERSFLRNRRTGHVHSIGYQYWDFTQALLSDLKQTHPEVNFIGIRLLSGKDFGGFIRRYCPSTSEDVIKRFRKMKNVTIKGTGYHSYFGLLSTGLYEDPEFEVEEGATKAKIKSAFVKSLRTKKLNKKVLGEFISLVA